MDWSDRALLALGENLRSDQIDSASGTGGHWRMQTIEALSGLHGRQRIYRTSGAIYRQAGCRRTRFSHIAARYGRTTRHVCGPRPVGRERGAATRIEVGARNQSAAAKKRARTTR